jgi:hypothetical protein
MKEIGNMTQIVICNILVKSFPLSHSSIGSNIKIDSRTVGQKSNSINLFFDASASFVLDESLRAETEAIIKEIGKIIKINIIKVPFSCPSDIIIVAIYRDHRALGQKSNNAKRIKAINKN